MTLQQHVDNLDRITKQLALEIKEGKDGETLQVLEFIFDNIETMTIIVTGEHKILYFNDAFQRFLDRNHMDIKIGENWWQHFFGTPEPHGWCPITETIKSRKVIKHRIDGEVTKKPYDFVCIPLAYDGISGVIAFVEEV